MTDTRLGRLGSMARAFGLALALVGLASHRSESAQTIAGRWSIDYAALMGAFAALWVASLIRVIRRWPASPAVGPTLCCDAAILAWGAGYFLGSATSAASSGRLADLVVTGAANPAAAGLEWTAMTLTLASVAWSVLPRVGPHARNVVVFLAAVVGTVLALEGLARLRAHAFPAMVGFPSYSSRAWAARYVRLNGVGLRDVPHRLEPPPGVRRLLAVGDSYAFGVGVTRTQGRFGEVLARLLTEATGSTWEPITAARPDQHTLQEFPLLERGLRYRPELVILLYAFNDVDYLVPTTPRPSFASGAPRSLGVLALRALYYNSYLCQEIYVRVRPALRGRSRNSPPGADPYEDSTVMKRHLEDLSRFVAAAGRAGAAVGIVPFEIDVAPGAPFADRYHGFVSRTRAAGLPVWPVDRPFLTRRRVELSVNNLDRHPNSLAHRLAAEAALPSVLQALALRATPRRLTSGHAEP